MFSVTGLYHEGLAILIFVVQERLIQSMKMRSIDIDGHVVCKITPN